MKILPAAVVRERRPETWCRKRLDVFDARDHFERAQRFGRMTQIEQLRVAGFYERCFNFPDRTAHPNALPQVISVGANVDAFLDHVRACTAERVTTVTSACGAAFAKKGLGSRS